MFTHKNDDFGAIFVTERSWAVPRRAALRRSPKCTVTYRKDVHTIANGFSCRHEKLKYPVQCEHSLKTYYGIRTNEINFWRKIIWKKAYLKACLNFNGIIQETISWYSETPSYGHLGNTVTSLLRPPFLGRLAKTAKHFLVKRPSLTNSAKFSFFNLAHWRSY